MKKFDLVCPECGDMNIKIIQDKEYPQELALECQDCDYAQPMSEIRDFMVESKEGSHERSSRS